MTDTHTGTLGGPFARLTAVESGMRIRDGEISALELTEASLKAAETLGADLGCFVTVDRDGAMRAASAAQAEIASGVCRGPLHGVPVAVKDVIATNGLRTTMGSRHFENHVPRVDAEAVRRLRDAGAIIIGKTTTHEFAFGPTGDRGLGGPARNPHDPRRMAGGSSGGSGSAVAAGIVPAALGTDTGGSVRIPAALCGVLGLRPTIGSVSSQGVFPLAPTMDVVGPLARSSGDLRVVWDVLSGSVDSAAWSGRQLGAADSPRCFRGRPLRVAVVQSGLTERLVPTQARAVQDAAARLSGAGFEVTGASVPELDEFHETYVAIQSAEAYAIHHERVLESPDLFDEEVLERLRAAGGLEGWRYVTALDRRRRLQAALDSSLQGTDILLLPTVPIEAPLVNQRRADFGAGWHSPRDALLALTEPFSVLGWPALSLPVAEGEGTLPASVQLAARPGQEQLLLHAADSLTA